ncbi:MAG: oxidoreductase [Bacillota bacterium]
MDGERIRVALVGAGRTGTPLLETLLRHDFVAVDMVADRLEEAPGMVLARARGIPTTTDFTRVARLKEPVDIIIEVSGDPGVRAALRLQLQLQNNRHTIIMHERIALLMISMARGELVRGHSGSEDYA